MRPEGADVDARLADAVALLGSGMPPGAAWREAHVPCSPEGMPDLAEASRGTAAAVRAAAALSDTAGVPLAATLRRALEVERGREEAREACDAALAGPRMSARVLGWLPLAGVGLATLLDPRAVDLLVATPAGWVLLVLGAVLTWCGRRWTRSLLAAATPPDEEIPPPLALAMVEACLSSGMDVASAVSAVGTVLGGAEGESLARTGIDLRAGKEWEEAWAATAPSPARALVRLRRRRRPAPAGGSPASLCGRVERALRVPYRCGASAVPALRAATEAELRRARREAHTAAGQLGVTLALPLTMCLLPAFVVVGIVPMVLAVVGSVELPTLPGA